MNKAELSLPWPPSINHLPTGSGIYRITDTSGRFYIGSACNLRKRWAGHIYRLKVGTHPNPILQAIWRSNPERLVFAVVEEVATDDLLVVEQKHLDAARVGKNRECMNILPIAGSPRGVKRSAETRARMSASKTGLTHTEESKSRMRAAKIGKPLSPEHIAKIAAKNLGRPGPVFSPDVIASFRAYSDSDVKELRRMVAAGSPVKTAAKLIGMSRATARRILSGKSYKEVL